MGCLQQQIAALSAACQAGFHKQPAEHPLRHECIMSALLLQPGTMRTALQLHREPPCCSGRGVALGPGALRLGSRDSWFCRQQASRRRAPARAEFSRDPRGGSGGTVGGGSGPTTQQQPYQQQPWAPDSYAYPPQPSSPPPRLPPNGNNGGGPDGGGGGGGASNLTRAFIAGAFILGGLLAGACRAIQGLMKYLTV